MNEISPVIPACAGMTGFLITDLFYQPPSDCGGSWLGLETSQS